MIIITTSRRPTRTMRSLANDLASSIPKATRVNRGKMSLRELAESAVERETECILIIDRWEEGLGRMNLFKIVNGRLTQLPPQIYVKGVRFRREFKARLKTIGSLFISKEAERPSMEITRLSNALSHFFNLPILDFKEVNSEYEATLRIYHRDVQSICFSFFLFPNMTEVGPRLKISHIMWGI